MSLRVTPGLVPWPVAMLLMQSIFEFLPHEALTIIIAPILMAGHITSIIKSKPVLASWPTSVISESIFDTFNAPRTPKMADPCGLSYGSY